MKINSGNRTFSVENLGCDRDHWWNSDFLELMSRRWHLEDRRRVLDLGCGAGHWSRILFPYLPGDALICGMDMCEDLLRRALGDVNKMPYARRFSAHKADIYKLPYLAESFDMVTAQTLWIHLRDVPSALNEVQRVLRPGGILAAAEPNNLAQCLFFNSLTKNSPPEAILQGVRQTLGHERNKMEEGYGNDSLGPLLPEYLWKAGFCNIQAYMSDRINLLNPPYSSNTQKEILAQMKQWNRGNLPLQQALESSTLFAAMPTLLLLVSGEKPQERSKNSARAHQPKYGSR
jgi:ubiquinone/menaquinone biosynthesis C-methylase UbiE